MQSINLYFVFISTTASGSIFEYHMFNTKQTRRYEKISLNDTHLKFETYFTHKTVTDETNLAI